MKKFATPSAIAITLYIFGIAAMEGRLAAQRLEGRILQDAPLFLLPDSKREPLVIMEAGVRVHIIRVEGAWINVTVEGSRWGDRTGYVEATFVQIFRVAPDRTPAAVATPLPAPAQPRETVPPATRETVVQTPKPPNTRPQPVTVAQTPVAAASGSGGVKFKDVKIRGYVTEMRSPTDFDIEDYRITKQDNFALDFENATPDVSFQLQDIRVGVELEIKGLLNEATGELKAKAIKVDLEQFRSMKQTAFVSVAPEGIQLFDGSWAGELKADGQVIRVTPATRVLFKPTKREQPLAEHRKQPESEAENDDVFEPLRSLDQVKVGMAMTYEGKRDRQSGKILADRVEFSTNDLEEGEARLWKSLRATVKPAQGLRPGELKIDHAGKYRLLPDDEVQKYVAAIGERLIPAYLREMPLDDPRRIPFQFHVVVDDSFNAFATPNGIVVVHSGALELLENEAQLAAVLGHEIAHATHEHTWRQQQYHKKTRVGIALAGVVADAYGFRSLTDLTTLVNASIVNGHQRQLENQSDRIGLEYMVAAGYDPRQAPAVWKLVAKNQGVSSTNFFWSSHDNEPTRRSYLMNELKNNYRDLDFDSLRTNADEFARMKTAVKRATSQKRKLKVS